MTRSKTAALTLTTGNNTFPICLGCVERLQGLPCICSDTFAATSREAPGSLLKLAVAAESEYLGELKNKLDALEHMREAAARVNAQYRSP